MNISGIQREQAKSRSTFGESWVKVSFQPREAPGQTANRKDTVANLPSERMELSLEAWPHLACRYRTGGGPASLGMTEVGSRENFKQPTGCSHSSDSALCRCWGLTIRTPRPGTKQAFSDYKWVCVSDGTRSITWSFAFFFFQEPGTSQVRKKPLE